MSIKKVIISLSLFAAIMLQWSGNVFAVPDLQLTVPGTYDTGTDTWVHTHDPGAPFDLTVISANNAKDHVYVSLALLDINGDSLPSGADLSSVSVVFNGTTYTGSDFSTVGTLTDPDGGTFNSSGYGQPAGISGGHSVFDTYFKVVDVGAFDLSETVSDTEPGQSGTADGEARDFSVTITGDYAVHFDAFYWDPEHGHDGDWESNPPSHDAESTPVPEPTTIALLSLGFAGIVGYRGRRRFLRKP